MEYDPITKDERTRLRSLARKQQEIAALPVMEERLLQWKSLNNGVPVIPPVVIETWTFDPEFMPEMQVLETVTDGARVIERQLLTNIRNHELLNDDKIIPPYFEISWHTETDKYGMSLEIVHALLPGVAYQYKHPIIHIEDDIGKIRPAQFRFSIEKTQRWKEYVEDIIGDILPVIVTGHPDPFSLTQNFIHLMGMEAFYFALIDSPDLIHRLLRQFTDDFIRISRIREGNGLLTAGNRSDHIISSHTILGNPTDPGPSRAVQLKESWGWAESQETTGISPAVFEEFFLPYYAQACSIMGYVYYGCCEPVHPVYEKLLQRIPNIRKFSISKWCDENLMGEALRGSGIVYSRKPDPTYVGLGGAILDEEGWRSHIRKTLLAAKGCSLEFIMRDIYSCSGNLDKARRAVEVAKEECARFLD
jgi:hypothetical protein